MNPSRTLAPQQAAALDAFAGAVRRLLGERLVVLKLFGSHARGEAAPDSDLDVLVAVEFRGHHTQFTSDATRVSGTVPRDPLATRAISGSSRFLRACLSLARTRTKRLWDV